MGFERQRFVTTGYGKPGYYDACGQHLWTASEAERAWLAEANLAYLAGDIKEIEWQPAPIPVKYRNCETDCTRTYRPDARVVWNGPEGEVWIEVKHGRIEQKAAKNMKAFCLTYPDRKLVLVWKGRLPKKGIMKRRLDSLLPHLDHVWRLK